MSARTLKRLRAAVAGVLVVTFGVAPAAHAIQSVSTSFEMPMKLNGTVATFECENSPGPRITFEGAITLGGVTVQLIFRNQRTDGAPHERTETVTVDGTGIAPGTQIVIPKQPSRDFVDGEGTGVGGNPFIWVQLVDTDGRALTDEIFLGRCVQGPIPVSADFLDKVVAQAILEVLDCTNNPGPFIYVSGSTSFSGVKARFIFRNNDNPVGGPHEASKIVDMTLVTNGFTLQFPKQPVQEGVGGNPWISVQFLSGGQPVGPEHLLGQCVQLKPGN